MKLFHATLLFSLILFTSVFSAPSLQDLKDGEWEFCGPDTLSVQSSFYVSGDTLIVPQLDWAWNWFYFSNDAGKTWTQSDSISDLEYVNFIVKYGDRYWTGGSGSSTSLYWSKNGTTWNDVSDIMPFHTSLSYDCAIMDSIMIVAGYGHLSRSEDWGRTWVNIEFPDWSNNYSAILGITAYKDKFFFAGYSGLYRSDDLGKTWNRCAAYILQNGFLAECHFINDAMYLVTEGYAYISHDMGETVERIFSPGGGNSLFIHPLDKKHFLIQKNSNYLHEFQLINDTCKLLDSLNIKVIDLHITDDYFYLSNTKGLWRQSIGSTPTINNKTPSQISSKMLSQSRNGITIHLNKRENISFDVYNLRGQRIIKQCEITLNSNISVLNFKEQYNLAAGRYVAKVSKTNQSESIAFIVE